MLLRLSGGRHKARHCLAADRSRPVDEPLPAPESDRFGNSYKGDRELSPDKCPSFNLYIFSMCAQRG